ncbi:MAG: proline iminopeptidase-family hydrolase [Bacteroidetes bacterium]|nr:proline iminopeptidase-family hydrolase [Bacteroidota bacterium]
MNILQICFIALVFIGFQSCKNDNSVNQTTEQTTSNLDVVEETIEINGVNHFIKKIGKGEPIVVLHGGPGLFHNYLVANFEKLAEKYQIIFYDQRGCGKTDFPKDTATITIQNFVEDLEAIRTHLKIEKMNLAGHSWGAILAINYAKQFPNNLNKLILISPAPANTEYFDQMFKNMQNKRKDDDIKEMVKIMSSKDFDDRKPEAVIAAIKIGDKVNLADQTKIDELYKSMIFTATSANNMLLVNSIMEKNFFDYNITENMNLITCPTLIILGDLDNVPFASSQLLQDNLQNARLEVLQHAAHYPFFEAQKEFNYAFDNFLNPEYE